MSSELKPRNGHVLVRIVEDDEVKGRIIVPSGVGPVPVRGIVLYVDQSYRLQDGQEMDLSPGDEVLFFRPNATDIRIEGEPMLLIHESKVVATTDSAAVYDHHE